MANIGIVICGRYSSCAGGKCLRSMKERVGGFARLDGGGELGEDGHGRAPFAAAMRGGGSVGTVAVSAGR